MAIKDILTIVDAFGRRPAVPVSVELARRLDAHLTGLSIAHNPIVPVAGLAPASETLVVGLREAWMEQARDADAAFQEAARLGGIRYEAQIIETLSEGYLPELVRRARLTDLAVIGQQNPDEPQPMRNAVIEALLFEGGAPLLLVPYVTTASDLSLDRPLIAWDGSTTAARAIRASLPLLEKSGSVTVLTVGDKRPEELADIGVYLDRHGLDVRVKQVPPDEIPVADLVLNVVSDEDFDWVVMGAYGHSRVREYLFGGATRDILGEMTVPVLMAH